jgi:hypothetical protein
VLKILNRWLQWLQNIKKPLVGLFLHLVWPKNEEDILLENFLFKLDVSGCNIPGHPSWDMLLQIML